MIRSIDYMGFPLDGLLYDAKRGVSLSVTLIYDFFCDCIERGEQPPREVAQFVANEIRTVTTGRQTPAAMFKKHATKAHRDPSEAASAVDLLRHGRTVEEAIEQAAELTGIPEGTVRRLYYETHERRTQRIGQVSRLLRELEDVQAKVPRHVEDRGTVESIFEEIRNIYSAEGLR